MIFTQIMRFASFLSACYMIGNGFAGIVLGDQMYAVARFAGASACLLMAIYCHAIEVGNKNTV